MTDVSQGVFDMFLYCTDRKPETVCYLLIGKVLVPAHTEHLSPAFWHVSYDLSYVSFHILGTHDLGCIGVCDACIIGQLLMQLPAYSPKVTEHLIAYGYKKITPDIPVYIQPFSRRPDTDKHILHQILRHLIITKKLPGKGYKQCIIPVEQLSEGTPVSLLDPLHEISVTLICHVSLFCFKIEHCAGIQFRHLRIDSVILEI